MLPWSILERPGILTWVDLEEYLSAVPQMCGMEMGLKWLRSNKQIRETSIWMIQGTLPWTVNIAIATGLHPTSMCWGYHICVHPFRNLNHPNHKADSDWRSTKWRGVKQCPRQLKPFVNDSGTCVVSRGCTLWRTKRLPIIVFVSLEPGIDDVETGFDHQLRRMHKPIKSWLLS